MDIGIIYQIMTVTCFIFTVYFAFKARKWLKLAKVYEPKVRQLASMLGEAGRDSRQEHKRQIVVDDAKKKVVQNIKMQIPFSENIFKGVTDDEALALMLDPRTLQGVLNTIGVGKAIIDQISNIHIRIPSLGRGDKAEELGKI